MAVRPTIGAKVESRDLFRCYFTRDRIDRGIIARRMRHDAENRPTHAIQQRHLPLHRRSAWWMTVRPRFANPTEHVTTAGVVRLIYDGDCPFCSRFVQYLQLKEAVERLVLINARDDEGVVAELRARGFDLNDGMLLDLDGHYYHGSDCVHVLAFLSSRTSTFNRWVYRLFRSKRRAGLLYPLLRFGRSLTLRILGIPRL